LAALSSGKYTPVANIFGTELAPEQVWKPWIRERPLALTGNRTHFFQPATLSSHGLQECFNFKEISLSSLPWKREQTVSPALQSAAATVHSQKRYELCNVAPIFPRADVTRDVTSVTL
jgi:hypothetical protein